MSKFRHCGSVFLAELAIVAALATSAFAQAPAPSPGANPISVNEQGAQLQQITVTGYIIPRVGEGPQPVTTLDQDFISKQGDQTVAEVLQRLPMTAGNFGPTTDPGITASPASASVRLHGLPSNFTLVLVDGKRM